MEGAFTSAAIGRAWSSGARRKAEATPPLEPSLGASRDGRLSLGRPHALEQGQPKHPLGISAGIETRDRAAHRMAHEREPGAPDSVDEGMEIRQVIGEVVIAARSDPI